MPYVDKTLVSTPHASRLLWRLQLRTRHYSQQSPNSSIIVLRPQASIYLPYASPPSIERFLWMVTPQARFGLESGLDQCLISRYLRHLLRPVDKHQW